MQQPNREQMRELARELYDRVETHAVSQKMNVDSLNINRNRVGRLVLKFKLVKVEHIQISLDEEKEMGNDMERI